MIGVAKSHEILEQTPTAEPNLFRSEVGGPWLPARGLLYSILVHALFVTLCSYIPSAYWMPHEVHLVISQSVIHEHEILTLPALEPMGRGSSQSSGSRMAAESRESDSTSASAHRAVQGVVYHGPQLIVSSPPHPDNSIQTIRQPDLPVKPRLPAPLSLPAMVSLAPVTPVLATREVQPAPDHPRENQAVQATAVQPIVLPSQQPKVEAPKLPLPTGGSTDALLHAVAISSGQGSQLKLAVQPATLDSGREPHNILIVNAIPVPDGKPAPIPSGELHGAFTVSPTPVSVRPETIRLARAGGGLEDKGDPGMNGPGGNAPLGTSSTPSNGSKSAGTSGSDSAAGTRIGSTAGTGHGGMGAGNGIGNGTGGRTHGSGNGNGAGSGSGSSPFPSITIQGGTGGSGRNTATSQVAPSRAQSSYGITIVASGASGGGFRDFGVFRDEASYTVYLDMADAGLYGTNWTMQYALELHRMSNSSAAPPRSHGLLVPPYAVLKSLPHFSPEAFYKVRGTTIVVFGVINPQGKFEDLKVMQSPDPSLNQSLVESLTRWTFQPAEIDGVRVPVKVLLGVPVTSAMAN